MKKLLKLSLLISILLLAFTVVCYADEPTGNTTTGDDTTTDGGTLPQTDNDEGDSEEPTTTTSDSYKASFKSVEDSFINVNVAVEGLPTSQSEYRYFVDTNPTSSYQNSNSPLRATEDGSYIGQGGEKNLIQLNSDLYIHIFNSDSEHTKVADLKIEKPTFNGLNYFYSASHSTKSGSQLLFSVPYTLNEDDMTRTIHFKIGRITDVDVLKAIKNSESDGFAKLKTFAKNDSSPLYDKNLTPNCFNGYMTNEEIIPGTSLANGAYYYLYAELDDENGKYIPLESITLAKADVYPTLDYDWFLFFYGSDKFSLDGFEDPVTPETPAEPETPPVLPQTGEKALVFALVGMTAVVAVVLFKKNKSLKIK